jgi:hypothetical protein
MHNSVSAANGKKFAKWYAHFIFLGILLALNLLVYSPGLKRFFAGDQWGFFLETHGSRSAWDGLKLTDYNINKDYFRGDELIFRPVFMIWLAALNTICHYNYIGWNLAHLLLHILVCFLLFQLLSSKGDMILAGLFTLLFSVMNSHIELVLWHHMGGYFIGLALFLGALLLVHKWLDHQGGQFTRRQLWAYFVLIFLALGCMETFHPLSLLLAGYVSWQMKPRGNQSRLKIFFTLLSPFICFLNIYAIRCLFAPRLTFLYMHGSSRGGDFIGFLQNIVVVFYNYLKFSVTFWNYDYVIVPYNRFIRYTLLEEGIGNLDVLVITILTGIWLTANFLLSLFSRNQTLLTNQPLITGQSYLWRQRYWLLFVFLVLLTYVATLCSGRPMNFVLQYSPYYLYFFCLFAIIFLASLIDFRGMNAFNRYVGGVLLLMLVGFHAWHTYQDCQRVAQVHGPVNAYFSKVHAFIREHEAEKDFSFAAGNVPENLDPAWEILVGYPDTGTFMKLHYAEVLYYRYVNKDSPKYLLSDELFKDRPRNKGPN